MRADDCKTLFDRLAAPLAVRHFAPVLWLSVAAGLAATVLIARALFLPGLVLLALAPVLDGVAGALARRGGGSPLLAAPLILFLPAFGFALALVNAHWISTVQTKVGMELQGRVMATNFMLMEAMVPLGYLSAGPLADRVFGPLMAGHGVWATIFGSVVGTGPGRGIGLILVLSGLFVALWAVAAYLYRPIRDLEDILPDARADEVIESDKDKLQEKADLALQAARRSSAEHV